MTGSSTQGIKTVLHPVSNLATAKAVYTALPGVPPTADGTPYLVPLSFDWFLRRARPGPASAGRVSRHPGRAQVTTQPRQV